MLALMICLAVFQGFPTDTTVLRMPSCRACTVTTPVVRTIRGLDVPAAAGSQQVVHHPSGRILLLDDGGHATPTIVDSTGHLATLSREGAGPGE